MSNLIISIVMGIGIGTIIVILGLIGFSKIVEAMEDIERG